MAIRRLLYILIPVLSVFLMSHNTFAYTDQPLMLNNYSIRETGGTWRRYDSFADGFYYFNINSANFYSSGFCGYLDHASAVSVDNMNFDKGTYFTLTIPLKSRTGLYVMSGVGGISVPHSGIGGTRVSVPWSVVETSSLYVSDVQNTAIDNAYTLISIVGVLNGDYNENTSTICMTQSSNTQPVVFDRYGLSGGAIGMGRGNISFFKDQNEALKNAIDEQNQKENQSVDNIDNQSSSDISGTENENTTNLINLFGSFVSAVSSASATNCNFAADFGNLDLGNLNFCRDNPPQFIQIIGSIILIALFVPLAYMLVNRIIGEIRSFTNG